jgi:hypothetical protein
MVKFNNLLIKLDSPLGAGLILCLSSLIFGLQLQTERLLQNRSKAVILRNRTASRFIGIVIIEVKGFFSPEYSGEKNDPDFLRELFCRSIANIK